jgi:hypothetical protein
LRHAGRLFFCFGYIKVNASHFCFSIASAKNSFIFVWRGASLQTVMPHSITSDRDKINASKKADRYVNTWLNENNQ